MKRSKNHRLDINYAKNEPWKLNLIIPPTPRIRFLTLPCFIFLTLFMYVGNYSPFNKFRVIGFIPLTFNPPPQRGEEINRHMTNNPPF